MLTYFAADGSYGDARGMYVVDTTEWTEYEWNMIDMTTDSERADVASSLAKSGWTTV